MAPIYLYTGPEFGMRDEAAEAVLKSLKKKFGEVEVEEHVYYLNETSIGQALSVLDNGNLFAVACRLFRILLFGIRVARYKECK